MAALASAGEQFLRVDLSPVEALTIAAADEIETTLREHPHAYIGTNDHTGEIVARVIGRHDGGAA